MSNNQRRTGLTVVIVPEFLLFCTAQIAFLLKNHRNYFTGHSLKWKPLHYRHSSSSFIHLIIDLNMLINKIQSSGEFRSEFIIDRASCLQWQIGEHQKFERSVAKKLAVSRLTHRWNLPVRCNRFFVINAQRFVMLRTNKQRGTCITLGIHKCVCSHRLRCGRQVFRSAAGCLFIVEFIDMKRGGIAITIQSNVCSQKLVGCESVKTRKLYITSFWLTSVNYLLL